IRRNGLLRLLAPVFLASLLAPGVGHALKVVPPPLLHLTWNAPYGEPRARTDIVTNCSVAAHDDTLWLTFEQPSNNLHCLSVSGALVFEPQQGDTLGSLWFFERGGANAGNIFIAYDMLPSPIVEKPWRGLVDGHVGCAHVGG